MNLATFPRQQAKPTWAPLPFVQKKKKNNNNNSKCGFPGLPGNCLAPEGRFQSTCWRAQGSRAAKAGWTGLLEEGLSGLGAPVCSQGDSSVS